MYLRADALSGPEALAGLNVDGSEVSFMERNWPFFSWAIFLFGSGVLAGRWKQRDQVWYGWLSVIMYCLHQSEEHAYDLRGWRYAFVPSLNFGPIREIFQEICAEGDVSCPLDPKITLYVNVVLIWIGFGGCMIAASFKPKRFLFAGSLNWGTAVVNGIGGHFVPAILSSSYNPGVVQSAIMVPLGIHIIRKSGRPWLCIANGIFLHVSLIMAVNVFFRFHTNEALTMSFFMIMSGLVFPLAVSNFLDDDSHNKIN